ncbi:toxin-antitoxin system YwqK family antitoxin [Shewanella sp. 0m-8]
MLLISVWLLSACGNDIQLPVSEDDLEQTRCSAQYQSDCPESYRGKLFTGIATNYAYGKAFYRVTQYQDGLEHGYSFSTLNNQLNETAWYKAGKLDGKQISYHFSTTGKPQWVRLYQAGAKTEHWLYNEQGVILSYKRFEGDKEVESISYEKGREWRLYYFVDGEKRQRHKDYYASGELESNSEFIYADYKKLNEKTYYSSGRLRSKFNYDRASNSGILETYGSDGKRRSEEHYGYNPLSTRHGVQLTFCGENGRVDSREHYNMGLEDGEFAKYHCNGQLIFKRTYVNGVVTDKQIKIYDENGLAVVIKKLDGKGKVTQESYYDDDSAKWVTYSTTD